MADKKSLWNEAAVGGLVLGGISIAYLTITWLTGKLTGSAVGMNFLVSIVNFLLWAAKLALCIILMRRFILGFYGRNPQSDSGRLFRYGTLIALYSALLYSAYYLVFVLYISPEAITQSLDTFIAAYGSSLDSTSLEMMENMSGSLPRISFFVNFFWSFFFGIVLSAIFSKAARPSDPFSDQ